MQLPQMITWIQNLTPLFVDDDDGIKKKVVRSNPLGYVKYVYEKKA